MTFDLLLDSAPFVETSPYQDFAVLVIVFYILGAAWDRLDDVMQRARDVLAGPEPSAIEELQQEYEAGEISLDEFEHRAELALDDRAAVVVDALQDVDGVGPERAAAVAEEFGNIEAVRRADVDDLTDVHGVGPSTAELIQNEW